MMCRIENSGPGSIAQKITSYVENSLIVLNQGCVCIWQEQGCYMPDMVSAMLYRSSALTEGSLRVGGTHVLWNSSDQDGEVSQLKNLLIIFTLICPHRLLEIEARHHQDTHSNYIEHSNDCSTAVLAEQQINLSTIVNTLQDLQCVDKLKVTRGTVQSAEHRSKLPGLAHRWLLGRGRSYINLA